MNAVEIEEALCLLAEHPFDPAGFPFAFLEAFGNKKTTLDRLKKGESNASDIEGGVLQRNHIHMAVCAEGTVSDTLVALKASPATTKTRNKVKFVLATDGVILEAEDLTSDIPPIACAYKDFPNHFGFFLPLAGITTVRQIRESSVDIKATGRLNKLYVTLLQDNPDWGTAERRHDMNHFMARLIFCFFAEDTDIFNGDDLFTATVNQMSACDASNTHEVISELFRAMNTKIADRARAGLPGWADGFPYVNGDLFSGRTDVPRFSRIARSYLLQIGALDWKKINPDIFGSMIQAVADDEERGKLGMHYTSVSNILKVLNPLFLDDVCAKLEAAGNSPQKLLNLRKRLSRIRVFDPACGSGNFLVIAYKEMRKIEAKINRRRGEADRRTEIPLTNFRGIEIRDFSAEIARLALIIAEYQCDVLYRGQQEARAEFLPLEKKNWVTCGNALRLDWLSICPPTAKGVKLASEDLFSTPLNQAEIDFENEGGETYIGSKWQSNEQKSDLAQIFEGQVKGWKSLDYVSGWFMKAAIFGKFTLTTSAFVATNSINQGQQVPILWPSIINSGNKIVFAHTSFKWSNLANHNAGVTVVIVGISNRKINSKKIFSISECGKNIIKKVNNINSYLISGENVIVHPVSKSLAGLPVMIRGNSPTDGGYLILEKNEVDSLNISEYAKSTFIRKFIGSRELISGNPRYCIWIEDNQVDEARSNPNIEERINRVREFRKSSKKKSTIKAANWPHRFDERKPIPNSPIICVPVISSENRPYLPADLIISGTIVSNKAFILEAEEIWPLALICSRLNLSWVAAVCARMRTDYSYTNTLGWNTLPIPQLTKKNKEDLTHCAEEILLAREAHFPKTIADLYDPKKMPENLRHAHKRNDEVLERIYIGRRFKNDTERLEKLFELYTKMTTGETPSRRDQSASEKSSLLRPGLR